MNKKDLSDHKKYIKLLKNQIMNFTVSFKKRYMLFPFNQVTKIKKSYDNEVVTINGSKYTIKELKQEISRIKRKLHGKVKPSDFNYILRAFIKDSKNLSDKNLQRVYTTYKNTLESDFKSIKLDLEFCLSGLTEINKMLKTKNKTINESYVDLLESEDKMDFINEDYFDDEFLELGCYTEGANFDMLKEYKTSLKKFRTHNKIIKKLIKNKQFTEAKREVNELVKALKGCERAIEDMEIDNGAPVFIIGIILNTLFMAITNLIIAIPCILIGAPGYLSLIKIPGVLDITSVGKRKAISLSIKDSDMALLSNINKSSIVASTVLLNSASLIKIGTDMLKQIIQICKNIQKKKINNESIELNDFNTFKNSLLMLIGNLIKHTKKLNNAIDEAESKYKNMNESADYEDMFIDSDINDIMIESAEDIETYQNMIITEGSNFSTLIKFKKGFKNFKESTKKAKKLLKNKKYKEAKNELKVSKKYLKEIQDEIRNLDDTVGSLIIGYIMSGFLNIIPRCILSIPGILGGLVLGQASTKGIEDFEAKRIKAIPELKGETLFYNVSTKMTIISEIVFSISKMIKQISAISNNIKEKTKNKKEIDFNDFNFFKNKIILIINDLIKDMDKLDNAIDAAEKEEKEKMKKESVELLSESEINQYIIESMESMDEYQDMIITEGTNLDTFKKFKEGFKKFKESTKKAKKLLKQKKYSEAKAELKYSKNYLKTLQNDIRDLDDNIGTAIIGFIFNGLFNMIPRYLLTLPAVIGVGTLFGSFISSLKAKNNSMNKLAAGSMAYAGLTSVTIISEFIFSISELIKQVSTICNNINEKHKKDKEIGIDDFNLFKNKAIMILKDLIKSMDKLDKAIDAAEKEEKEKEKLAKESVYDDDTVALMEEAEIRDQKLLIYEAYQSGAIDLDTREELISNAIEEIHCKYSMESVENDVEEDDSPYEKYNTIKKVLYEKCGKGEISEDERELLLEEAYNRYMESDEVPSTTETKPEDNKNQNKEIDKDVKKVTDDIEKNLGKDTDIE